MSAQASEQEPERARPRAPRRAARASSSQTRNCGESTLPNATNATTAAAAYRTNRSARRPAACERDPDERRARPHLRERREHGEASADGAGQVLRARARRPVERHRRSEWWSASRIPRRGSRSAAAGRAGARSESEHAVGGDDDEREVDEHGTTRGRDATSRAARAVPPRRYAATETSGSEHGGIELHGDRERRGRRAAPLVAPGDEEARAPPATSAAGSRSKRVRTTAPSSSDSEARSPSGRPGDPPSRRRGAAGSAATSSTPTATARPSRRAKTIRYAVERVRHERRQHEARAARRADTRRRSRGRARRRSRSARRTCGRPGCR